MECIKNLKNKGYLDSTGHWSTTGFNSANMVLLSVICEKHFLQTKFQRNPFAKISDAEIRSKRYFFQNYFDVQFE